MLICLKQHIQAFQSLTHRWTVSYPEDISHLTLRTARPFAQTLHCHGSNQAAASTPIQRRPLYLENITNRRQYSVMIHPEPLSPKRDILLLTATVNQLMIEALDAFNAFIRSGQFWGQTFPYSFRAGRFGFGLNSLSVPIRLKQQVQALRSLDIPSDYL